MRFDWKSALGWASVSGWSYFLHWLTGGGVPFLLAFFGSLIAGVVAILVADKMLGGR